MQKRTIVLLLVGACALAAVGANPRYLEEIRVGGGCGSTPDGGADFEADGDIVTDGAVTARGSLSHAGRLADVSLAGYWPLNEGAGAIARDASVNSNTGAITPGSGSWTDDSPFRAAYNFSGSRIDCGTAADLCGMGPQTICAWVKASGWGGGTSGQIVSRSDPADFRDGLYLNQSTASLAMRRKFSGVDGRWRSAPSSMVLNRWTFVAVTYDPSIATNTPTFYINGRPLATEVAQAPSGTPQTSANARFLIGDWNGTYAFAGRIAEVRFYRRILSDDEIQELYHAQSESPTFANVAAAGGSVESGVEGSARGTVTLTRGAGGNTPGCLRLTSPNGTIWNLFVSDAGVVRVHSALPSSNTDGVVVGAQQ